MMIIAMVMMIVLIIGVMGNDDDEMWLYVITSVCDFLYLCIFKRNRSVYLVWCVTNILKGDVKNGNQVMMQ